MIRRRIAFLPLRSLSLLHPGSNAARRRHCCGAHQTVNIGHLQHRVHVQAQFCTVTEKSGPSRMSRFMVFWNRYGWVFIGTYLGIEYSLLLTLFVGAANGLVTPENLDSLLMMLGYEQTTARNLDVIEQYIVLANMIGFDRFFDVEQMRSLDPQTLHYAGSFVVAYIANKFCEPPRLAISLAITPAVARYAMATQNTTRSCNNTPYSCILPGSLKDL